MPEIITFGDLLQLILIILFVAIFTGLHIASTNLRDWWRDKRLKNPALPKINIVAIYFGMVILFLIALPLARYLGWYGR